MKTKPLHFLYLACLLMCLLSPSAFSQKGVRVQIPDSDVLPSLKRLQTGNVEVQFGDPNIDQLLAGYTILECDKEFPMFQDIPQLRDFYLIVYADTLNDLDADLSQYNYFPIIETVGKGEVLGIPTDYSATPSYDAMNVTGAWNITEGNPAVKTGVIDTYLPTIGSGLLADLADQIEFANPNTFLNIGNIFHSLVVTSTIGATPNNGTAVYVAGSGIGYNGRIYSSPLGFITWDIQFLVARGARVINISATNLACSATGNAAEQLFYDALAQKGVIVVAAAGNGQIGFGAHVYNDGVSDYCSSGIAGAAVFCDPQYVHSNGYIYPAAYNNVISVSGVSLTDNLYADYQNYNGIPNNPATNFDCNSDGFYDVSQQGTLTLNDKVDVLAHSCVPNSLGHGTTSLNSPMVAGVIALMLSVNPNLDVAEVIDIINNTGVDVTTAGTNNLGPNFNNSDYFSATPNPYKLQPQVRRIDAQAAVAEAQLRYQIWLAAQSPAPLYTSVTTGGHVTDGISSFSTNWIDYDQDGDLDIFNGVNLATPQNPSFDFHMYENMCSGAQAFPEVDLPGFTPNGVYIEGIGWGDFDNDGDKDFIGYDPSSNEVFFYQNSGSSSFLPISVGIVPTTDQLRGPSVADFNNDGNIDFIIGKRLITGSGPHAFVYSGNGTGAFSLVSNASSIYSDPLSFYDSATGDLNGDGNQDVAIIGAFGTQLIHIFFGDGAFGFTEIAIDPALANLPGYGIQMIDYDNDTDLDIYCFTTPNGTLLNNLNNGKFHFVDNVKIVTDPTLSNGHATWGDYNNDGYLDVYVPNLNTKTLYNNIRGILFEPANNELPSNLSQANHETAGAAFGDPDNDGDLDLYVNNFFNNDLNNYFYENSGNTNNWVKLLLEGTYTDLLSNGRKTSISAEGARVTLSLTSYTSAYGNVACSQTRYVQTNDGNSHDLHFGLGTQSGSVSIKVDWPSGVVEYYTIGVNQCYKIIEGQGLQANQCGCQQDVPYGNELSGEVGLDLDLDCDCDDDDNAILDYPMDNFFVQITEITNNQPNTSEVYYAQTQGNGSYSILLPDGDYQVTPYLSGTAYDVSDNCATSPLPEDNYSITLPPDATDIDFCLQSSSCDVDVTIYPVYQSPLSAPCPEIQQEYCMTIVNNGNTISNPVFTFDLDDNLSIISATSSCGVVQITSGSNIVSVTPSAGFNPQQTCTICAIVEINPNTLGAFLTTTGSVNGQCQEQSSITEFVNCAYDPNDKLLVNPQSCGPENNISKDEMLIYRIRFQNEGNAPANTVIIKDILDDELDFSTFEVLQSSHTVTGVYVLPTKKLIIEFENIQLPALSTDTAGSQGYVVIGIKPYANAPEGSVVENTASIYFDLNEAVVTNTTMNTLREYPYPDVTFDYERTCNYIGMSYDFQYSGATPDGATYSWSFGSSASPATSSVQNPSNIVFSTSGSQTVTLTVTRYGCSQTFTQVINVAKPTGCQGKPNKITLCKGGREICVSINAAQALIENNGYCVGPCSGRASEPIESSRSLVYPNPSKDKFLVEMYDSNVEYHYAIYDIVGHMIYNAVSEENSFTLDLSNYPAGLYTLIVKYDDLEEHIKLIKE